MSTPKPVRTIELMLDGQHLDLRMLWTFLVSEYKTLCILASVDSIPTNCDREDHVSMGPIAGFKALQVIEEHVRQILAIELWSEPRPWIYATMLLCRRD